VLKSIIRRALAPLSGHLTRGVVPVLTYHRFGSAFRGLSAAVFESQLVYLKRNYHVTTLHELVTRLSANAEFVPNSVVLTVDDGYRDFLEVAYPLLRKHQLTVTLFLVAQVLLERSWLWFDRLHYVAHAAPAGAVRLEVAGGVRTYQLGSRESRNAAWESIADCCLELDAEQRDALIDRFELETGTTVPGEAPPAYAYLTVSDLARLDPAVVDIGSHSLTHPILTKCDYERQRREIAGSRELLAAALRRDLTSFAYPNGRLCDIDARSVQLARSAGYSSAVTCDGSFVRRGANPHLLSRIGAAYTLAGFREQLDGVSYWSSRLQRRGELAGAAE